MWMVRCDGGETVGDFLNGNYVALGWSLTGDLSLLSGRQAIIEKVKECWPEYPRMKVIVTGSQLNKIANLIQVGDHVVTYDPNSRIYHVGVITGAYVYAGEEYSQTSHRREVSWKKQVERDTLSISSKNTLGSTLSLFQVSEKASEELLAQTTKTFDIKYHDDVGIEDDSIFDVQSVLEDTRQKAREFIKDKLIKLDWEDMQYLIAGIIRALGYKTTVSAPGSDRGKDIIASPDGLGLSHPRIVVEVKHRPQSQMGSGEIRSFLGGRHKDDKGLYVSTGGFSKDARYEAERAQIPLTLIDSDTLIDLILENYDKMDGDARSLLPLTKIYWPTS